jgi:hypothetical protein
LNELFASQKAHMAKNVWHGMILMSAVAVAVAPTLPAHAQKSQNDAQVTPITTTRNVRLEQEIATLLEDESRFTLTLRREPLADVMALIEKATAVRFRCGALPDAAISVNAQDAPLFSTIEPLFQEIGFAVRREGLNLYVFNNRAPGIGDNAPDAPLAWQVWQGKGAPPAGWANLRLRGVGRTGRVSADALVNSSPLSVEWNAPKADGASANWQAAALELDNERRPGIAITAPLQAGNGAVWMRWPLNLREVPAGAQLLIETPSDATFYVNGAPLMAGRRGSVLVDLGRVLQPGANCLALHWPRAGDLKGAPLLRYEWFIAGKMNAPSTVAAPLAMPLPQISQPVLTRPDGPNRPGNAGSTIADVPRPR